VPLFIRKGRCIPVAASAECVAQIDYDTIRMVGYDGADYELYNDDGMSRL
jgi:alpha-glucosidase